MSNRRIDVDRRIVFRLVQLGFLTRPVMKQLLNMTHESCCIDWLSQECIRIDLHGQPDEGTLREPRQQGERQTSRHSRLAGSQILEELEPIGMRHVEIRDDAICRPA